MIILYIIRNVASFALLVVQIAMMVRAVMSWFPSIADNVIGDVVYTMTEPFIIPVRSLMEKIDWVKNSPIDISFFVTFFILALIYDIIA